MGLENKKEFILFLVLSAVAVGATIEKWSISDYWQKLEIKMSDSAVTDLLGQPLENETINGTQVWYYQQAPERDGDRVVSRPRCGYLKFRKVESECLLFDWKEPDWTTTSPHTEAQYQAGQRLLAQQVKAEQDRLLREEQQAQRLAVAERVWAEGEAARLKAAGNAPRISFGIPAASFPVNFSDLFFLSLFRLPSSGSVSL